MKTRFNTVDIIAMISELNRTIVGMRVIQIYDIDHKTYLFKLNRHEEKSVLLIESGSRIHTTEFTWPKNNSPSGFAMKLRKHLKNKRIEHISQLGVDRVIDIQMGINEAAYHVILELYDRGNIALTDHEYTILNILRPRAVGDEDVKLVVRERYPIENAVQEKPMLTEVEVTDLLTSAKPGDNLRKVLNPKVIYGPAVLEHALQTQGLSASLKIGKGFDISNNMSQLMESLKSAEECMKEAKENPCKGYIIQKLEKRVQPAEDGSTEIASYFEFHPFLFRQHENSSYNEFPSFSVAVDQFFSSIETQKINLKAHNLEKDALKKLENVRLDHEKRLTALEKTQVEDVQKAQFIEMNLALVDKAILILRSAIASQMSWNEIDDVVKDAQAQGDPVACAIKQLKLDSNHFSIELTDPYAENSSSDGEDQAEENDKKPLKTEIVDIDLDLTAYANAKKYYDQKRFAAKKQQKTIESSAKAFKSAERKTKETLKQVAITTTIAKTRKTYWFEKFFWFISSENYLVIGGRDAQQNEMIVKRYLRSGDLYVHADLHGASSIVIKNPSGAPVPPKTLNEAGTMAICYSGAWEAKVVTSAWWVYHHQVSKTAPTGEYLTPGAFMIRGKKNYLPPSYLIMGFGFMFKLDEDSIERHANERRVRTEEELSESDTLSVTTDGGEADIEIDEKSSSDEDEQPEQDKPNDKDQQSALKDEESDTDEKPDEKIQFPDTVLKLPHEVTKETPEEGEIVYCQRRTSKPRAKGKPSAAKPTKEHQICKSDASTQQEGAPKRGQKSKIKKIKEKYKDQDEEERELKMKILASAGTENRKKKKGKEVAIKTSKPINKPLLKTESKQPKSSDDKILHKVAKPEGDFSDNEDEEEDDSTQSDEDKKILNSLTGCPLSEDDLLFAVTVCAPYSAMQNYKYKVKVMPGTGRRGKAAKTALNVFLHEKTGTQRERDLLRSTKDQDISRNIPGKVKLSAPNLSKRK